MSILEQILCVALCDLVPFVQFKKRENIHEGVSLKLYKLYQIAQNITYVMHYAISYRSLFGVWMIVRTHANVCQRFFLPSCRFYPFV